MAIDSIGDGEVLVVVVGVKGNVWVGLGQKSTPPLRTYSRTGKKSECPGMIRVPEIDGWAKDTNKVGAGQGRNQNYAPWLYW